MWVIMLCVKSEEIVVKIPCDLTYNLGSKFFCWTMSSGRWLKKKAEVKEPEVYLTVLDGIKKIYANKIKPVEQTYNFDSFNSPLLRDRDFDAKPMVLLLGQYSTGKTSFIRYLLEMDYPGQVKYWI